MSSYMFYPDPIIDIMFIGLFILTFFESFRHNVSLPLSYFCMYLLKIRTVSCLTSVRSSNTEKYTDIRQSNLGPALTSRHCSSWFFITETTMITEVFSLPPFTVLLDISRVFSWPHSDQSLSLSCVAHRLGISEECPLFTFLTVSELWFICCFLVIGC